MSVSSVIGGWYPNPHGLQPVSATSLSRSGPCRSLVDFGTVLTLLLLVLGDHALTGLAIGKMLGIAGNGSVISGPEIDAMDDVQLRGVGMGLMQYASNVLSIHVNSMARVLLCHWASGWEALL